MHQALYKAFGGAKGIEDLRASIAGIAEKYMWDGETAAPGNASDLHQSSKGGPGISVNELKSRARDGARDFKQVVIEGDLKVP